MINKFISKTILNFVKSRESQVAIFLQFLTFIVKNSSKTFKKDKESSQKLAISSHIIILATLSLLFLALGEVSAANLTKEILLSMGEHQEISLYGLEKFSLTNKEVIHHKYLQAQQKILIRGKKQGYSELITWHQFGPYKKVTYKLYVLSKIQQLKRMHLLKIFTNLKLTASMEGEQIFIKGELKNLKSYQKYKELEEKHRELLFSQVQISDQTYRQIMRNTYQILLKNGVKSIRCEREFSDLYCFYHQENDNDEKKEVEINRILKSLKKRYFIHFTKERNEGLQENFQVHFKIIQLENSSGKEISLGLNQLQGDLRELFDHGITSLIQKNSLYFSENNLTIKTLAEPIIKTLLGSKNSLELGNSTPIITSIHNNNNNSGTKESRIAQWKFSGLKIQFSMNQIKKNFQLNHKIELTKSGTKSDISGSKQKGETFLELEHPIILFQVGHRNEGLMISKFPLLGHIPFIGKLFQATKKTLRYQKIIGLVRIQKTNQINRNQIISKKNHTQNGKKLWMKHSLL